MNKLNAVLSVIAVFLVASVAHADGPMVVTIESQPVVNMPAGTATGGASASGFSLVGNTTSAGGNAVAPVLFAITQSSGSHGSNISD